MSEIRSSEPEFLGSIISRFLHETGIEESITGFEIPALWNDTVGEKVAAVTKVLSFDKGTLVIGTVSSTWRAELLLRKESIIGQLNDKLRRNAVKELIIR